MVVAAELEMRAAEEPLKSDLDVAGLKAQVPLGRRKRSRVSHTYAYGG